MAEVGVHVMGSGVIKLWLCGVDQHRHQASESPQGKVQDKGKLEAHQQGQSAWGVQGTTVARHDETESEFEGRSRSKKRVEQ